MTTTTSISRYRINGVIDTGKSVMSNLENIANSAASWITYDITDGKWAVVINKAESSAHSFNDSNIVGPIKLSGSGLDELYNSVEVQFPMRDMSDDNDYIRIDIPSGDRKPNEPDHTLTLNYPLVTNPVQATLLGFLELKQSRVDYVIEFSTDYSKNDVLAGDVIDVTAETYGFTNKLFRVLQIQEIDSNAGLEYKITALEYDATVYDTGTLEYYQRSNADGVITIGDIGKMATPTVTKTETDRKPSVLIESTIPDNTDVNNQAGIIEGVEIWYYIIPASELPTWETVDDEARVYELHSTVKPFGEVYAPGAAFAHSISDFDANNILIKLRAVNSVTQGPYSTRSGLVAYVPKQTTDNITNNTEVDTGSGNILTSLGASALIGFINSMMRDGSSGVGSMFEKIFDIFDTKEGFALNDPKLKQVALASNGPMISAANDTSTVTGIRQSVNDTDSVLFYTSSNFSPTKTGLHKLDVIIDQNSSGANGGRGSTYNEVEDAIAFRIDVKDLTAGGTNVLTETSGGTGAFAWTDFAMTGAVSLTAGSNYRLEATMINYTESNTSATADVTIGWNAYTVS